MDTLPLHGLRVRYADTGTGTPVVLAHGSSASHRVWAALSDSLAPRYRVVAPDLIGYGRSDPWPPGRAFRPDADAEVLVALAERTGERVHLVGHSYGGAMALEAARALGDRVLSLSLVEPVSFHLLRLAGRDREWQEVAALAWAVRDAVADGRHRRAARLYMGYWTGRTRWALAPRRARAAVLASMPKVAHEFGIVERADVYLRDYAALDVPTRLVVGERTRRAARAIVEVLAEVLPAAEVAEVLGAGHMSPVTHRDAVHALLTSHIDRQQARADRLVAAPGPARRRTAGPREAAPGPEPRARRRRDTG
ncbi:alpha/beta fold hydrolase [Rubrivirga sp. IMCC45206]|uniref:alpha/beta fold hydrolase n=1 Tax=Rubrivirga sp. IMCC45206 TaxID=3391614 RepID=UPI00398FAF78